MEEIMTAPVVTVEEPSSIEDAMRIMTENRIRHLPVVRGRRLVGMVSIGDLVSWQINAQKEAINRLEQYISGSYPG